VSKETKPPNDVNPPAPAGTGVKAFVPITTRLAIEIPKPKDWQAFQRNCVLLFRSELKDPHAQEYGRAGQKQRGIDILGRRDGRGDHFVGVQCRLIVNPLKEAKILSDARAALELKADLKELIFATTAKDDTGAADAAIAVTRALKAEGHDLEVAVYGWGQLQTLIALHEQAHNAFHPSAVASAAHQNTALSADQPELAALIASQVVEQLRNSVFTAPQREVATGADEDPALHARIDTFRDLFNDQDETILAKKGLLSILDTEDLSDKPWARYRIETNLGAIAIDLGREEEAAGRFETAHSIRPEDPNALANLALARTIQGRFDEAIEAARSALAGEPRADHAVGYLLQAAAQSDFKGDPESLIPADMIGSTHADLGLAEYLRRRSPPHWEGSVLEIVRRHPDASEFTRVRSVAILALAVESADTIAGGHGPVTTQELNAAADDTKKLAEHCLDVGFQDTHDLVAHLNNAAVLLRLCQRHAESEELLVKGISRIGDEPQLRRLLAIARAAQGRDDEAIQTLRDDADPENQIFRAELLASTGDLPGALASALAIETDGVSDRIIRLRWRIIGEVAVRLGDDAALTSAVGGLRSLDPDDIAASLLEIRADRKASADDEAAQTRLRALAATVPADLDMMSRYFLAAELKHQDLPEEASHLLEGHVDLSRQSPSTTLFLDSLAAARRDKAFRQALAESDPEVRNDPETLWTVAAHAWNLGDLAASLTAVDELLQQQPDEPRARLLRIEILIRQDRSNELFAELEKPLERLAWQRPSDQFRLASLLGHFGFVERAAELAYRLFLQHRDRSRAWMTLSMLVLGEGQGDQNAGTLWDASQVAPNMAVDLKFDDGSDLFFVVEPDAGLRRLDPESWELDHATVRNVIGLKVGDTFVAPDGRSGEVSQIRHKYVARFHYVIDHHESRFPEIFGFKRVAVDVDQPGGLDGLIAQLKSRREWIEQEQAQYLNGPMPLGILAHRLGMDTIEVAAGLAEQGLKLKVAIGNLEEREAANEAVNDNAKRGCVLDLLAFWTIWRLEAFDAVRATCGPIHLPPSVLDRLRARRERLEAFTADSHKSASYEKGKIVLQETPAEVVCKLREEVDRALVWAESNATILPIVASDELPEALREHLRLGRSDICDSVVVAHQNSLLLVTDDLTTRQLDRLMGGAGGAWLHVVFGVACNRGNINFDQYVRWSANLVGAGHNYLGVSGAALAQAARLDALSEGSPGYLFRTLSQQIGGSAAEPVSHIQATIDCLQELWSDVAAARYREPVTGYLLRQLVRQRQADYPIILRTVLASVWRQPHLIEYIRDWLHGHFMSKAVLNPNQKAKRPRGGSKK